MKDEGGYILISEIIKEHIAEHNDDVEVINRCQQALTILEMYREE